MKYHSDDISFLVESNEIDSNKAMATSVQASFWSILLDANNQITIIS